MNEVVDTNVILRFLVGDNKLQQKLARDWFKEAQSGSRKLIIKPVVVAESCFVLESFYKKSREDISAAFVTLLSQKWLKVEGRKPMLLVWKWYEKGNHFVDSYLAAFANCNNSKVISFDKKVLKLLKT